MVRAILSGAKSQTRRVVKSAPEDWSPIGPEMFAPTVVDRHGDDQPGAAVYGAGNDDGSDWVRCPYGAPGDHLWGREAWGYRCSSSTCEEGQFNHTIQYRADDARQQFGPMPMEGVGLPKWKERDEGMSWDAWDDRMTRYWRQWRPSIHMPRWASRITLEITEVRVERLGDISEADAVAEGIRISSQARRSDTCYGIYECVMPNGKTHFNDSAYELYRLLWSRINGVGSWDANPYVWVVCFRRIDAS
jgi:hypothetical protein